MLTTDERQHFFSLLNRGYNEQYIAEAKRELERYADQIADLENEDTKARCRYELARAGLELSQRIAPQLTVLADALLEAGGREAIVEVCKPMTHQGTGFDGRAIAPTPSGYTVPPRYASLVDRVVAKVAG